MESKKTITIDGEEYIRKSDVNIIEPTTDYVIVRTYSAGVFAGYITNRSADGKQMTMNNVRCLWYWDGAASLMQLASDGTCKPNDCKFTKTIEKIELTEVIEILYCSNKAAKQIKEIKSWIIS